MPTVKIIYIKFNVPITSLSVSDVSSVELDEPVKEVSSVSEDSVVPVSEVFSISIIVDSSVGGGIVVFLVSSLTGVVSDLEESVVSFVFRSVTSVIVSGNKR